MSKSKDYIEGIEGGERRTIKTTIEFRAEGGQEYIEGVGAVFGAVTDLGYFTEEIAVGAFDEVLNDDVRGLFNHDEDLVLGRTKSGTMVTTVDNVNVRYQIKYNPNDPDHVRVMEKIKRGDVSESSFAFSVKDDKWETKNGKDHRIVQKIKRWYDVSPVTYPAYSNTSVAARSLDKVKQESGEYKKDLAEMDVESMKQDLNRLQ